MRYKLISPDVLDPGPYKQTEIYLLTSTPDKLKKYILDITENSTYKLREFAEKVIIPLIGNKVVLTDYDPSKPMFLELLDGRILARVPNNNQEKLSTMFGAIVFYKLKSLTHVSNTIVSVLVDIYSRLFVKNYNRSMIQQDSLQLLTYYFTAWFLQLSGNFSMSNYLVLLKKLNVSSPSKNIVSVVTESLKDSVTFYNRLCKEMDIDPTILKSRIANRYGIDMIMGIEDGIHGLTLAMQSVMLKYPAQIRTLVSVDSEDMIKDITKRLVTTIK